MSSHETSKYVPTHPVAKWFEDRLPLIGFTKSTLIDYPTPKNLNYWWTFGGILAFMLGVQIVTGIVLAMHYTPNAALAFDSVELIKRDVNGGRLIQAVHATGASMFFFAVYVHIFRGLYFGSYKAPREILWILGVIIYLLMMATAFFGYVLPWGQMSFWAAAVITNIFAAIPVIGDPILQLLRGGFAVDNPTLNRFFSLHYLLPFMIAGVTVLHVWALHVAGQNNPMGVEIKSKKDTVPFTPYATVKDAFAVTLFLILYGWFVFFMPDALGHADNYIPANPLATPTHIVPEWYFLPFYAILRAFDNKLVGVLAMGLSIACIFALPWLDSSRVRSMRFRPTARAMFFIFVAACIILGFCGAHPPDEFAIPVGDGGLTWTWLSRIALVLYFGFFFSMPFIGLFEKTLPVPDSISSPVLSHIATAPEGAAAAQQKD